MSDYLARYPSPAGPPASQQGSSLVEVLVAQLVFAVGLLGLVGMQMLALQGGFDATQLTRATALGRDILTAIRHNPGQADLYRVADFGGGEGAPEPDCLAVVCAPEQLARHDLGHWQRELQRTLSEGRLCIEFSGSLVSVVLAWRGLAPGPQAGAVAGQLPDCGSGLGLYGEADSDRRWLRLVGPVLSP